MKQQFISIRSVFWVFSIVVGISVIGCGEEEPNSEYRTALNRWTNHAISSYQIEFKQGCFCRPEVQSKVIVSVEDNEIISITDHETGALLDQEIWYNFKTITDIFELINRGIDQGAVFRSVEYDPELGYPAFVDVNFHPGATDSEWEARVTLLEAESGP